MSSTRPAIPQPTWISRQFGGYFQKWVVLGALIGVVSGLAAIVFYYSIDFFTCALLEAAAAYKVPNPRGEGLPAVVGLGRPWAVPLITTLGGLVSGVIVFSLAPEAEGHGTDAAINAFHEKEGRIAPHIPVIKLIASSITIGSGGSAGREGPTAQIAAGFGSWLATILRLSPQDRRIALAVGVGSGVGAIFKAPFAGAILCAEILYIRDFELDALVPGFVASVVGYMIFGSVTGWSPVFGRGLGLEFTDPASLPWYAILGVLAGFSGILYVHTFYDTRSRFHVLKIPPHVKPALGGLGMGLIALAFPQVLGLGYGWMQIALDGDTAQLAVSTMLALVFLKIVATSLSIGSGGSGGVFAPGLFIGAMLGGALWGLLDGHVPGLPATPAPFVVVGMMALFGGIAKAPIAVILMVAEMTNEFSMIIPAMLATSVAYIISGETRIYQSQLATRADSPAHKGEYAVPLIQAITVGQAMRTSVVTAASDEPLLEAERRLSEFGLRGLPVVDGGRLVGMLTATDALRARQQGLDRVGQVMSRNLVLAHPSESLHTALQRMAGAGISRLPVVERGRPDKLLGILSVRDLASALDLEVGDIASRIAVAGSPTTAHDPLGSVLVRDIMARDFPMLSGQARLDEAATAIAHSSLDAALIVDDEGYLKGIVTSPDIERAAGLGDGTADEAASHEMVVTRPLQTVAEAFAQPGAEALRQLPVVEVEGANLRPVGVLRRRDVIAAYLRGRDRAEARSALDQRAREPTDITTLHLRVSDDDGLVGKPLADLMLPPGSLITSVARNGRIEVPRGDFVLLPGDRLEVLSTIEAVPDVMRCLSS